MNNTKPIPAQDVGTGASLGHYRLSIEAFGLRQSDAAAQALTLIGMMMQTAHTKGHSCGGTSGNASGRWEHFVPNIADHAQPGGSA